MLENCSKVHGDASAAAHAWDDGMDNQGRRRRSDSEGQCSPKARTFAGRVQRHKHLTFCLLALAATGSLVHNTQAMPSDAPWGDTWSDGSGVLAPKVMALEEFYDCTVTGDHIMYKTLAVCTTACYAGECVQKSAMGELSAPELVILHPTTSRARDVVLVTLSPVIQVGDSLRMLIKAVNSSITISVQEDPGLPIGMTAELNEAHSELTVAWSPRIGQEGYVHEVGPRSASLFIQSFRLPLAVCSSCVIH